MIKLVNNAKMRCKGSTIMRSTQLFTPLFRPEHVFYSVLLGYIGYFILFCISLYAYNIGK